MRTNEKSYTALNEVCTKSREIEDVNLECCQLLDELTITKAEQIRILNDMLTNGRTDGNARELADLQRKDTELTDRVAALKNRVKDLKKEYNKARAEYRNIPYYTESITGNICTVTDKMHGVSFSFDTSDVLGIETGRVIIESEETPANLADIVADLMAEVHARHPKRSTNE